MVYARSRVSVFWLAIAVFALSAIPCFAAVAGPQTFNISYQFSRNGKSWSGSSGSVKATSDTGAIAQIASRYPYVRNIKIISTSSPSRTYNVSYQFSQNGKSWSGSSGSVKATSDEGAIAQIASRYPYVRNIRITSVR